jgi:hypothetical protein
MRDIGRGAQITAVYVIAQIRVQTQTGKTDKSSRKHEVVDDDGAPQALANWSQHVLFPRVINREKVVISRNRS